MAATGCWAAVTFCFTVVMYACWGITAFSVLLLIFGEDAEFAHSLGYVFFPCAIFFTGLHLLFRRGIPEALDIFIYWPFD